MASSPTNTESTDQTDDRVKKLQRAIYALVWRRTGFGEQCLHCGHSYPGHEHKCKVAEIEDLLR